MNLHAPSRTVLVEVVARPAVVPAPVPAAPAVAPLAAAPPAAPYREPGPARIPRPAEGGKRRR